MSPASKPPSGTLNPRRLDVKAFAQAGALLTGSWPLQDLPRLCADLMAPVAPDATVDWSARGEWRAGAPGTGPQPWMHLEVQSTVPLACQRCLAAVDTELRVDRWFRFVADEGAAEAQDDDCEEDLLASEPRPDLLEVIEDELIMALPLVPMHDQCPQPPEALQGAALGPVEDEAPRRPNPFAALKGLKGRP